MNFWPKDTEFIFYTEGFEIPPTERLTQKDFRDITDFSDWKLRHSAYIAPSWQYDVVRYSHKVFAAIDALYDYDGVGVWLDADCVTYKLIPEGLIEKQLNGCFMACYQRTGMYTETGMWIMDCSHPEKKAFLDFWRAIYFTERYKDLLQWHDCMTLDACLRYFRNRVTVHNLSGEHAKAMHPQALSELGKYIDHCKGPRKIKGVSHENKHRKVHDPAIQ
jgi:hypothetical protein